MKSALESHIKFTRASLKYYERTNDLKKVLSSTMKLVVFCVLLALTLQVRIKAIIERPKKKSFICMFAIIC